MKEFRISIEGATKAFRNLSKSIRLSGIEVDNFRIPRKKKKRLMGEINYICKAS